MSNQPQNGETNIWVTGYKTILPDGSLPMIVYVVARNRNSPLRTFYTSASDPSDRPYLNMAGTVGVGLRESLLFHRT